MTDGDELIRGIEHSAFYITADLPGTCDPHRQIVYLDDALELVRRHYAGRAEGAVTERVDELPLKTATDIIEGIWSRWYGKHHGDVDTDIMAGILADAKLKITNALSNLCEKTDAEMERVKACDHIAEGDMEGNDWRILRNVCPSTAAVAALRDKYEALLMRASSKAAMGHVPAGGEDK